MFEHTTFELIALAIALTSNLYLAVQMAKLKYYDDLSPFWVSVGCGVSYFMLNLILLSIFAAIIGLVLHYVFGVNPVYEVGGYSWL